MIEVAEATGNPAALSFALYAWYAFGRPRPPRVGVQPPRRDQRAERV